MNTRFSSGNIENLKAEKEIQKKAVSYEHAGYLIIPGLFEPPVRTLRATIPENESHIFR